MSERTPVDGSRTGLKILVVDDRPENLLSMSHLLRRPDLEILTAESGEEALHLMLDHELALVLLDVQMPEMDGFEVAELMRANERTRNVPIIFVTAINKERQHIFHGYETGAVDYLFKPVDPFIIRSKVDVFLELKRMELIRESLLDELNLANRRLRELSDNKSEFLSAASHELRTPLTVIKENCALVRDEVVGSTTDDQHRCMEAALRNCNRLSQLVNDLLDLDSIESGYGNLMRHEVDVRAILETCAADFGRHCEKAGLDLYTEIPETILPVLGDPGLITQVVVNLVGNAVKFSPEGGRIALGAFPGRNGLTIRVQDEGPGIAPEDQRRVFEKFTQVNRTFAPGPQGTGLGLAISSKIAELLDGRLELQSEVGVGSTFSFGVPWYSPEAQLRAFVRDATRNLLGVRRDWTLLLFTVEGEHEVPDWLQREMERTIRYGHDRLQEVEIAGRQHLGVLLRTDASGAASFLTRLEEQVSRRGDRPDVRYALHPLAEKDQAAFRIADEEMVYMNLSLGGMPAGEHREQGKNPGR